MRLLEFLRPFRVIVSRRVSEEEQASVEVFARTEEQTVKRLELILATFRDHRKRTNDEVVRATQQQLASLDTAIQNRGDQLKACDEQIAEKQSELRRLNDEINKKRGKVGLAAQPVLPRSTGMGNGLTETFGSKR